MRNINENLSEHYESILYLFLLSVAAYLLYQKIIQVFGTLPEFNYEREILYYQSYDSENILTSFIPTGFFQNWFLTSPSFNFLNFFYVEILRNENSFIFSTSAKTILQIEGLELNLIDFKYEYSLFTIRNLFSPTNEEDNIPRLDQ